MNYRSLSSSLFCLVGLCFFVLLTPAAHAAISLVVNTSTYGTSGALNAGGATVLVAFVGSDSSQSNAPSDSQSNTWTLATTTKVSTAYLSIYYVCNPTVASNQTFTNNVSSGGSWLLVSAFSGTATSSCLDTYNGNGTTTNTDTITTGSVTPAASGELLVTDALKINGGIDTFSINDGFSLLDQPTAFTPISADAYLVASNTNPIDPTWTNAQSVTDLVANIIAFKAAPDTTPPSITVTSPTFGSSVSSAITLSASSTDNVAVAGVQFQIDGVNLGSEVTATSGPTIYSTTWNTASSTNGTHIISAIAYDTSNNSSTATTSVTVANPAILQVTTSTSLSFSALHGSTATSSQNIVITNSAGTSTTLNWSATSTQSWLTFNHASGTLAGTASTSLAFIANPTGLSVGTYNATATIADPNASSSSQESCGILRYLGRQHAAFSHSHRAHLRIHRLKHRNDLCFFH